jgi:hypothetical protein
MGWTYMSSIDKVVLYGGLNDQGTLGGTSVNETWFWDDGTRAWSQQTNATISTGPHSSTRMVYDKLLNASGHTNGNVVLFGGIYCNGMGMCPITDGSTWFYDGTNTTSSWSPCNCSSGSTPQMRASEGLTVDLAVAGSPVVVLMGGDVGKNIGDPDQALIPQNDTWILSGTDTAAASWTQCLSSNYCNGTQPGKRSSPELTYYGATGKAIMFGGTGVSPDPTVWGDTWRYDQTLSTGNRWSQCTDAGCSPVNNDCSITSGAPCSRYGDRTAFFNSGTTQEIAMFGGIPIGGSGNPALLSDTWLYTGNPGAWVLCGTSNGCPSNPLAVQARCCVGLTYDSKRNVIVLFGGGNLPKPKAFYDVWVWTPNPAPPPPLIQGWQCVTPTGTCNSSP